MIKTINQVVSQLETHILQTISEETDTTSRHNHVLFNSLPRTAPTHAAGSNWKTTTNSEVNNLVSFINKHNTSGDWVAFLRRRYTNRQYIFGHPLFLTPEINR